MSDDRDLDRPELEDEELPERWPVGFILIIVAAALYLGFRAVQLVQLAIDWLR